MADQAPETPTKEPKQQPLPHYALPNFSTVLPTYSNHESDVIAQAFRIGNFLSLQDLPSRIKPGQVSRSRCQKILDNRQPSDAATDPSARYQPKPKLFSEFEYMPSPYSIVETIHAQERAEQKASLEKAGHKKPFVLADTAVKLKYEDGFHGGIRPYKDTPDPWEAADDQALRHKWLQDAQILAGPWRPSGRVKGSTGEAATEIPCAKSLPEIIESLRKDLESDWEDYDFIVCSTDDEHIVIRFELSTLDSEPGLVAYMNIFARSNSNVNKNKLSKVVEDWNVTPSDGFLYFTLRPPWVSARVADTYYSLHPEERSYNDPRLTKSLMMRSGAQSNAELPPGNDQSTDELNGASTRPELA
uniref:Uncharacterized protein n=1 Tax=Chrysotila carterae TaxID=13221 RepID=A0A7S4B770_CHRCT|mmetsp:Transcript_37730/g.83064  ORF Transcript_37730/g.83064 Transcript_37730/m.83064 type:complete len:359 (-) Transcript_37730:66-1142(-)